LAVQLILDQSSVKETRGVSYCLNQAKKHSENPVLIPGCPHEWDSLQINWSSKVIYDPEERLFKCWYNGLDAIQYDVERFPERKAFANWLGRLWRVGYA